MAERMKKQTPVSITSRPDGTVSIFLDGKEVSDIVIRGDLSFEPQHITLTLEYACFDQLTFEGGVEVHHVCPKKAR